MVHDFAENVIRPAATEWDEREEFRTPSSRSRQIGIYGSSCSGSRDGRRTGLTLPVAVEEVFWGDGIGMAIMGQGWRRPASRRARRSRDGVGAAVLRHRRQVQLRGVLRQRADAGIRRVEPAEAAVYDEASENGC